MPANSCGNSETQGLQFRLYCHRFFKVLIFCLFLCADKNLELKNMALKRREKSMNIVTLIIMIVGGAAGLLSTLYIIISLFATLGYKIYRKIKYGISLYN